MRIQAVDLYWFSGTGNTYLAAAEVAATLARGGVEVAQFRMETADPCLIRGERTIGLAFPVAFQSTYPLVWKFVRNLPPSSGTGVFVLDTLHMFSGGLLGPLRSRLRSKGYTPLGATEIRMPSNFLRRHLDPDRDAEMLQRGRVAAAHFAQRLLAGTATWGRVAVLPDMLCWLSTRRTLWALMRRLLPLRVDTAACTRCGLCVRLCPVANIQLRPTPVFARRCQLCMRCLSGCPEQAIQTGTKRHAPYRAVAAERLLEPEWANARQASTGGGGPERPEME